MNELSRPSSLGYGAGQLGPQTNEEARPFTRSMTELAATIGDLETAARDLARRIAPILPSGSPFERAEKERVEGANVPVPRAVRSQLGDELQARIYALRALTGSLNSMAKDCEL